MAMDFPFNYGRSGANSISDQFSFHVSYLTTAKTSIEDLKKNAVPICKSGGDSFDAMEIGTNVDRLQRYPILYDSPAWSIMTVSQDSWSVTATTTAVGCWWRPWKRIKTHISSKRPLQWWKYQKWTAKPHGEVLVVVGWHLVAALLEWPALDGKLPWKNHHSLRHCCKTMRTTRHGSTIYLFDLGPH